MKPTVYSQILPILLSSFLIFLTGCEVVGGIFKLGLWAGIIIVVLVVGIIAFIVSKLSKSGPKS